MNIENIYQLSESQIRQLPTDSDVEFYREHGWYVFDNMFSDDEIAQLRDEMSLFYAGKRDRELPLHPKRVAYWKPEHGDIFRINDYIIYENRTIASILTKKLMGAVAARLCGEDVRVFNTSLMHKPPNAPAGSSVVGWHTDRAYWRTCSSSEMLTAWIPLHDSDESNGTITMIDGSHKWSETDDSDEKRALHFIRSDLYDLESNLEKNSGGSTVKKVPMMLKKGQVSFHHCLTYHGSSNNVSDHPRLAFSLHMQNKSNRYREFPFRNGRLATYNSDELCRKDNSGNPDYTDPDFFPNFG